MTTTTEATPTTTTTDTARPPADALDLVARIGEWPGHARARYYALSVADVFGEMEALTDAIDRLTSECPAEHAEDPDQHGAALEVLGLLRAQLAAQERMLARLVPREVNALVEADRADLCERPAPTPWRGCA